MRINLASVYVDDQDKALRFYTEVLGFAAKEDFPVGIPFTSFAVDGVAAEHGACAGWGRASPNRRPIWEPRPPPGSRTRAAA